MTFLEAARLVLEEANTPLHYEEITRRALAKGILTTSGATPDATMGSRLGVVSRQEDSDIVQVGRGVFDIARRTHKGLDHLIDQANHDTKVTLKQKLHSMNPKQFELLIRNLLLEMGFDEATLKTTPYTRDGGIDVVGVYRAGGLTNLNAAVQVKRWQKNVQAPEVTRLRGSLDPNQQGIIITTSNFSKGAREEANTPNRVGIGLVDGDELISLLIKHRVGVVHKMHTIVQLDEDYWQAQEETESTSLAGAGVQEPPRDGARIARSIPVKPASVQILGRAYPIQSWREGLLKVAEVLYRNDPGVFEEKVFGLRTRTRVHVADSPDGMHTPAQIDGLAVFVETNQSKSSVKAIAQMMLLATGHSGVELSWTEAE